MKFKHTSYEQLFTMFHNLYIDELKKTTILTYIYIYIYIYLV